MMDKNRTDQRCVPPSLGPVAWSHKRSAAVKGRHTSSLREYRRCQLILEIDRTNPFCAATKFGCCKKTAYRWYRRTDETSTEKNSPTAGFRDWEADTSDAERPNPFRCSVDLYGGTAVFDYQSGRPFAWRIRSSFYPVDSWRPGDGGKPWRDNRMYIRKYCRANFVWGGPETSQVKILGKTEYRKRRGIQKTGCLYLRNISLRSEKAEWGS